MGNKIGIIRIEQNIFTIFLLWTFACISGLGFQFQLLPRLERFLIYGTINP
jgi:4-hydroxybenzoate polyprenyltransferase